MGASTSTLPHSNTINECCVLRRNVGIQPYGRCSVCSLHLRQCHAWQSQIFAFFTIIGALALLVVPEGWPRAVFVVAILGAVVVQGLLNHRRTDELIGSGHELQRLNQALIGKQALIERQNARLEAEVRARTEDLRHANVRLAQRNLELIDLDSRRVALLSNASHELKTPLTSVRGAAQNLRDGVAGELTDDQAEYVDIVVAESARLLRVVTDFLAAGRVESGQLELREEAFDLRDLASQVASNATNERVEVVVDGSEAFVVGDSEKVRQALANLVENAVKYSDAGGRVAIDVGRRDDAVLVAVTDHGLGIDPDEVPLLFEQFFRARSASERPGTGLGLALARNLARLHGGDIHVESVLGEGSTFTLQLPVRRTGMAEAA